MICLHHTGEALLPVSEQTTPSVYSSTPASRGTGRRRGEDDWWTSSRSHCRARDSASNVSRRASCIFPRTATVSPLPLAPYATRRSREVSNFAHLIGLWPAHIQKLHPCLRLAGFSLGRRAGERQGSRSSPPASLCATPHSLCRSPPTPFLRHTSYCHPQMRSFDRSSRGNGGYIIHDRVI